MEGYRERIMIQEDLGSQEQERRKKNTKQKNRRGVEHTKKETQK